MTGYQQLVHIWNSKNFICPSAHWTLVSGPITRQKLLSLKSTLPRPPVSLASRTPLSPVSPPTSLATLPQVSVWALHPPSSPTVEEFPTVLC